MPSGIREPTPPLFPRASSRTKPKPYKAGGISGIGGATGSNVYLVHVLVPTGDFVTSVEVMENDFQDIDVLIGMDVIVFGDFLITNKDGKTTFQFRTPSEGGVEL